MDKIELESRYDDGKGAKTWLEEVSPNKYAVHTREDWMPIYVTGTPPDNIEALDFDGGPYIGLGSVINGKVIKDIVYEEGFYIIFE